MIARLLSITKHLRHNVIFPELLAAGVFVLKRISDGRLCRRLTKEIARCGPNTVGYALDKFIKQNDFELVPGYERHDIKHVILEYGVDASSEMRMQAFLLGNKRFSLFTLTAFLFFVIWTPEMWPEIPYHYRLGQLTGRMGRLPIEKTIHANLNGFRKQIAYDQAREKLRNLKEANWKNMMRLMLNAVA